MTARSASALMSVSAWQLVCWLSDFLVHPDWLDARSVEGVEGMHQGRNWMESRKKGAQKVGLVGMLF